MKKLRFTGEELARKAHLDLPQKEFDERVRNNEIKRPRAYGNGFFAVLWRKINPRKIFFIRFADSHGVIIMADNEEDACIQAVPFLNENAHHCKDPLYNKSCDECQAIFDELADKLNHSTVTWLGWGCPNYNWVIHT